MAEKISQKKAPRINNAEMQNALNRIYDHINELVVSVNASSTDAEGVGDGKEGDMRVVKTSNREVRLEVRVDEGWYTSTIVDTDPNVVKLIGETGVAAVTTIPNSGGIPVNVSSATLVAENANFEQAVSSLTAKLNEVIDIINNMNSSGFKMIDRRSN